MEIIGKVKNIVPKTNNHLVFLEDKDKTMLSAFGSNKVLKEGKTYKFQCTKNGDFINYDKKKVVEVFEDGPQLEVKEEIVGKHKHKYPEAKEGERPAPFSFSHAELVIH